MGGEEGEEVGTGEGAGGGAGDAEGAEDAGTAAVLGGGDPLEIRRVIVEDVAVEVVADLSREWRTIDSRTDDAMGEQIIADNQVLRMT